MKIAFFDLLQSEQRVFKIISANYDCVFNKSSLTKQIASTISDTQVLYIRSIAKLTKEILVELPQLEFITTRSTGFDHIDLEYCKKHKIVVSSVPTYATNAVAEHTFALLLGLSRKLLLCINQTKHGIVDAEKLRGFELKGKTLGVIGFGNIGSRVVEIARGFDMHILVTTKHPSTSRANKHRVQFVDLPTLLQKSDIVSLHVPLTDETKHMINQNNIHLFKKDSILINTSRGPVVDTDALILGLETGVLAGAGIDVLEDERVFKRKYRTLRNRSRFLLEHNNVIITPHNAYNTKEAYQTILNLSAENISAYIKGKPINRVL